MVDAAATNTAVAIVIAVPPVIIRAVPLSVVPGVADVRRDLLGIGLGVGLGLAPTNIILIITLVTMALDVNGLSLPFLPPLL